MADTQATDPAISVQTRQPRNALSIATLCVAAIVCVQIGAIRVMEREGGETRAAELAALRRERSEEVDSLRAELERVEHEVERLRHELASAASLGTALEIALLAADTTREQLSERVSALSEALETQRPFLDVYLAPSESPSTLAAIAENRGEHPLSIRESRGWLWVDGAPLALDGSLTPTELSPGSAADVFEFDPRNHSLEFVSDSEVPVKGVLCFVFGHTLRNDSVPWVEERWFEYRPADGIAATVRRDSWPLAEGVAPCRLDDAQPPW